MADPVATPPAAAPAAPAPSPVGDPPPAATVATDPPSGDPPSGDTPPPAPAKDWPDDWRTKLAGGNEDVAKRLGRYQSPKAIADALIAAQNKISSGEVKAGLPKDATPEQVAAWRKDHGIPDKPDGYDLKDVKFAETNKPIVDKLLAAAHETNQTPAQAKAMVLASEKIIEDMRAQRLEQDAQLKVTTEDALRAEWGDEYRRNINLLKNHIPEGIADRLLSGRLADGNPIGSDPEVLKWLVAEALAKNPSGVIVPQGGSGAVADVETRIKQIETMMRDNRKAYDKDEKVQEEYRRLIDYRLQHTKQAA